MRVMPSRDPFDSPWKPLGSPPPRETAHKVSSPAPQTSLRPQFDQVDDLRAAVDAHGKSIVEHALGANRWNQRQTAKALGLTYDQLRHTMKKHAIGQSD